MSTSEEEWSQRLQRDFSGLRDANRGVRSRALKHISRVLDETPKDSAFSAAFSKLFVLSNALTKALSDESERCRDLACQILLTFLGSTAQNLEQDAIDDLQAHVLGEVVEVFAQRVGVSPFVESAEEIRLQLLKLLGACVASHALESVADALCVALGKALGDNFPEAKREAAQLTLTLCRRIPVIIRRHQEPVLKGLLGNMGHQHSKTRAITLQAISAVVACGSDAAEKLWSQRLSPLFCQKIMFDHSPNVRCQLYRTCARWLRIQMGDDSVLHFGEVEPSLLAVVLAGTIDDHETVAEDAKALMEKLGEAYLHMRNEADRMETEGGANVVEDERASSTYVVVHLRRILLQMIAEASHWTAGTRSHALLRLEALTNYAGSAIEGWLDQILATLASAFADDTADVIAAARRVSQRIGNVIDPQQSLYVVLPNASGQVDGGATASAMTGYMELLSSLLDGMYDNTTHDLPESKLRDMARDVSRALVAPEVCSEVVDDESGRLALALGHALCAFCCRRPRAWSSAAGTTTLQDVVGRMPDVLQACVTATAILAVNGAESGSSMVENTPLALDLDISPYAEGMNSDSDILEALKCDEDAYASPRIHGLAALSMLSRNGCGGDVQLLLMNVLSPTLARLSCTVSLPPAPNSKEDPGDQSSKLWTADDGQAKAWCALLRLCRGSKALETCLHQIYAVISAHVGDDARTSIEVKLPMLLMLDYVLGQLGLPAPAILCELSGPILLNVIAPNIVWRAGRAAAMVRKIALACAEGLLRSGAAAPQTLVACAATLMPLLRTCLEDYDGTSRRLASAALCRILQSLKQSIAEEPIQAMYHDLSKKLDDSDDLVRLQACRTLRAFYESAVPGALRGTMVDWSAQTLLVHMDDPDRKVQEEIYQTLLVLVECSGAEGAKVLVRKAEQARLSHRTPDYCDKLIAAVQQN